ncbi:DUF4136 domain-containing protein [Hymenobacter sp. B81]|uniref:DUF4136 domain-containing protein n=1 Tax=Hymenobacter sp. B81 TaxID=3344878 RepID=UPI0037DCC3ED
MKTSWFLPLLLLWLSACSSTDIKSTEQTPGVDFSAYRTYNFLDVQARNEAAFAAPGSAIADLKTAVARELERRGYQRADAPDLWVNIGVVTQDQVQTRQTDIREAPRYIGQRRYSWQSEEVVVDRYEVGTVTVELVDAARNERVWQGVAASTLTDDPQKLTRRIDEGMSKLFEKYPLSPPQP